MSATTLDSTVGFSDAPDTGNTAAQTEVVLSLPGIHCAGCIGKVERTLNGISGVRDARVNLSRKRVTVAGSGLTAQPLIAALGGVGFDALELDAQVMGATETDSYGRGLLIRLAVAGFAMMNVMLFSVAVWSGAADATRTLFHWISAAIAVPTLIFSAQVFFTSAWSALRVRRLNMDVPISLAIILAAALSVYQTAQGGDQVYFDAALSLTFFLLVGRYLDHRMRVAARSAAQELSALEVPRADLVTEHGTRTIDVATLRVGDTIAVAAGGRFPVDGTVLTGRSEIDRSFLSGESLPVPVGHGDVVVSGDVNLGGMLHVNVTATGEDTTLRRMAALVEVAENGRNRYTALADRAAQIYAPAVHLVALLTFIGWVVTTGDAARSLNVAIAVLIITCPCALGLAVPAVMTAANGRLFRRGILVKSGTALERLAEATDVVFDKTGTLTEGHARLDLDGVTPDAVSVLAALAGASHHPVSRAIAAAIPSGVTAAQLENIREVPGSGVEADWNGTTVRLGKGAWVGASQSLAFRIGTGEPFALTIAEKLRDGAVDTVRGLEGLGLGVHLYSGDAQAPVDRISAALSIDAPRSGMSPQEKLDAIKALSGDDGHVLMIGDGLNDTAALAGAHVSMSPASALDASRAASDFVLLGRSLREIPFAVETARSARSRVKENFMIAAGYNLIAVPVAIMGFATPLSAAIAMSVSSLTVLMNALRLR